MSDDIAFGAGTGNPEPAATACGRDGTTTKNDRIRERELFRFYRPKELRDESRDCTPVSSSAPALDRESTPPISNNDVTLGALAQLVALRLGVHRAMINVIGRETQYTLVESTKTLDLDNQTTSEIAGDECWVGSGGSMHKQQSICETVVELPVDGSQGSFLVIPDLTLDARFKTRSYVQGFPHYRFYAGTPLKTASGVVIGALCAFAHQPRAGLKPSEQTFLLTIADTIMQHFEMKRAAAERNRVTTMSKGLNAFVTGSIAPSAAKFEGQKTFRDSSRSPLSDDGRPNAPYSTIAKYSLDDQMTEIAKLSHEDSVGTTTGPGTLSSEVGVSGRLPNETSSSTRTGRQEFDPATAGQPARSESAADTVLDGQVQSTAERAAGLLGEALTLKNGGGVVFFDPVTRIDLPSDPDSSPSSPFEKTDENGGLSDGAITPVVFDGVIDSEEARAPVLGAKVTAELDTKEIDQTYRELTSRTLAKFIKRYPLGKMWEFDDHGVIPSVDVPHQPTMRAEREARQRAEGSILTRLFPRARSLIFIPLWDANLSRHHAGCFVWTTDAMARFSADVEFSFVTAFGNSISAEISRLATMDADQRKSDFIGSISHELRSPLHGVLSAANLLAETELDSYQSAVASTIDNCARTLLDTISHVLDYSKINSLRRTYKKESKTELSRTSKSPKEAIEFSGVMSILGSTDLAAVTEEVVDSVYAGKMYTSAFAHSDMTDLSLKREAEHQPKLDPQAKSRVSVLLDIAPGDYQFISQAGAVRRIVMNLFGNALKYTSEGSVIVRLFQEGIEGSTQPETRHKVVLVVKDTGQGISSSYLRTRLYTPFAQENDLAPGTGLGLSIVRTIVSMLRGDISMRSQKGVGTEVRVVFQHMSRPGADANNGEPETPRPTLEDFRYLRVVNRSLRVGLYGFGQAKGALMEKTEEILRQYLQEFCHARCVTDWRAGPQPEVFVVDEEALSLLEHDRSVDQETPVIVLCRQAAPIQSANGPTAHHHFLLKPFGPYKLARALRRCLVNPRKRSITQLGSAAEGRAFEGIIGTAGHKSGDVAVRQNGEPSATRFNRPRLHSISTDTLTAVKLSITADTATDPHGGREGDDQAGQVTPPAPSSARRKRNPGSGRQVIINEAHARIRVLAVDDNNTNLSLLTGHLRHKGFKPDTAVNGAIALEAATRTHYDVILMDLMMPVMGGLEATREIRKHEEKLHRARRQQPYLTEARLSAQNLSEAQAKATALLTAPLSETASKQPATPPASSTAVASTPAKRAFIIACTANASARDQQEAFAAGLDHYMTKPFEFKELTKRIVEGAESGSRIPFSS